MVIDSNPVFDQALIVTKLKQLQESFAKNVIPSFITNTSPVPKTDLGDIFATNTCNDNVEASINIATIKLIAMIWCDDKLNEDDITNKEMVVVLDALHSTAAAPAEQALGHCTCHKLQTLDN